MDAKVPLEGLLGKLGRLPKSKYLQCFWNMQPLRRGRFFGSLADKNKSGVQPSPLTKNVRKSPTWPQSRPQACPKGHFGELPIAFRFIWCPLAYFGVLESARVAQVDPMVSEWSPGTP